MPLIRPILICTAILVALTAQLSAQTIDPSLARLGNGIAAIAEGRIITVEELRKEIQPIIPRLRVESKTQEEFSQRLDEISREVLQNMVDRIIIVKAAEDDGLLLPQSYIDQEYEDTIDRDFGGDRGRFLEFLRSQGLTTRQFREKVYERIVVSVMRAQNRRSQSEISPERIQEFYIKNKLRFYQEEAMHLRQIILSPLADEGMGPLRQTADTIISELNKGTNFGDLARKYSQDSMSRRGGDWGWIERKDLRTELSKAAFELQPGQYSQPIELGGTLFILYCEDRREEIIQPVAEVRDIIENILVGEIARETQEKWLIDVRERSYIRFYM
ncbi:MAG: peptidylprolyl isomerase [Verrucomicrobiota bacterium]